MPSIDTLLKEKKKFRPTKFRAWTYNEDLSKGYQDDDKRLSKGYQDDDKRLSKGYQDDDKRLSKGYQDDDKRLSKGYQDDDKRLSKGYQDDDKRLSKGYQDDDKRLSKGYQDDDKRLSKGYQDDDKRLSKGYQDDDKRLSKGYQDDDKRLSKGYQDDDKRLSKGYQDDDKRLSKEGDIKFISNQILQLTGYQKTIFEFVIKQIKVSNDLTSNPISNSEMLTKTNISPMLVKLSINRLFSKNLLEKHNLSKNGRNGFRIFKINAKVKKASSIIFNNNDPLEEKVINDKTSLTSSSSNNKTTTTIEKEVLNSEDLKKETLFPAEWKKINYAPLENIGFNASHLKDIQESNLANPDVVQESIYHFAFGLEHNKEKYKDYKNPLNVFIGRLRKGKGWFESNYESEKDKALKELVLVKKRQEMEQKKIIKEISDMEFPKWRSKLTQEEIKEIVPNVAFQLGESTIDTVLRCHFEAEVLPKNLEQQNTL